MQLTELWSRLTPGPLTAAELLADGAVLGDESGLVLTVTSAGDVVSERPLPGPIHDIAVDPYAGLLAICFGHNEIALIADQQVVFRTAVDPDVTMVGIGPHGDYLLGLAPSGEGVFLNGYGREMGTMQVPGGAGSMAVIPESGMVVTTNRYGQVHCFTSWGKPAWSSELSGTLGRVATDEKGGMILIPTMAYGVEALSSEGTPIGAYDVGEPIRAAACSGDATLLLLATSDDQLVLMKEDATVISAEKFPAPVTGLRLARDGRTALVLTGSGYAHLLGVADRGEMRRLEIGASGNGARPQYLMRKQVFSPFTMVLQTGLAFPPDSSYVVVAGDRRRVSVLNLAGEDIDLRRYGGHLLDLSVRTDGSIRVVSTQSVFRFTPGEDGSVPEWAGQTELASASREDPDSAVAVTENGEFLEFPAEGGSRKLFHLGDPGMSHFVLNQGRIVVSMKSGELLFYTKEGEAVATSGPWPMAPQILASSESGVLVGMRKMLVLLTCDGREMWRKHLEAEVAQGVALPGVFAIVDADGIVHAVTLKGKVRRLFSAGEGTLHAFPDGGEGPGFLVVDGDLITAVHPNGEPRWRFRTPKDIARVGCSADGLLVGVFTDIDLYLFPLTDTIPGAEPKATAGSPEYLEFPDG